MRRRGPIEIAPVHLPEFDLDVNFAMCRNPMCRNFGVDFRGTIPSDRTQVTNDLYLVRVKSGPALHQDIVCEITCLYCGQSARLASNHAIRKIARYYLSLSLPFADCTTPDCPNHGINLFEHWEKKGSGARTRKPYHRDWEHGVRCGPCRADRRRADKDRDSQSTASKTAITLGTSPRLANPMEPRAAPPRTEETKEERKKRLRAEKAVADDVQGLWRNIIDGVRAKRSVTDSVEILEIGVGAYYRNLDRIGGRLRDCHSYLNAGLLRPDIPRRKTPVRVYTDVLKVSLKANSETQRHVFLNFIVSTIPVRPEPTKEEPEPRETIFILAAHPYFLPRELLPEDDEAVFDADMELPEFVSEWACLAHAPPTNPRFTADKRKKLMPIMARGGYFIRSPFAEMAHFLVVQKLLSRFDSIHCYMDAAKELYSAALVAYRDRIRAGNPKAPLAADRRRRRRTAEIVLFQHDKEAPRKKVPPPSPSSKEGESEDPLGDAWKEMEERFHEQEVPNDLLKEPFGRTNSKVRAQLFRRALRGANSKTGNWAWLRYPLPSLAYRSPRSLWLTRMVGKRFDTHGRKLLSAATLQPVDSIFNSIRARTSGPGRPQLRAKGRSYRESYFLPSVVLNEISIYLLLRNYTLRRKTVQKAIPAEAMGLLPPKAAKIVLPDCAANFRLGLSHAEKITRWRKR